MSKFVFFIVGPTASGKSDIACEIAQKVRGEIISADSMQVYQGMDIGTAKPGLEQQKNIRHHLIDICDPSQDFSAHEFVSRAEAAIVDIISRDKQPIVCGGTGLYVRSLIHGLSPGVQSSASLKQSIFEDRQRLGLHAMYLRLQKLDPDRSQRIEPSDERRILRALEIIQLSGKPVSDLYQKHGGLLSKGYKVAVRGILMSRPRLYERIDRRVDEMIQRGLWQEAQNLFQHSRSKTSNQAVGYKEIYDHLLDPQSRSREQTIALIKQRSRNLAKRQMTWFKKEPGMEWTEYSDSDSIQSMAQKVLDSLQERI